MKLIEKNTLLLRTHVADLPEHDTVKSVSVMLAFTPCVEFKDGSMILFSWEEIIDQAIEFKTKSISGAQNEFVFVKKY